MFAALRRRAGAAVFALFLLRMLSPELGHMCADMSQTVRAVTSAATAPMVMHDHQHAESGMPVHAANEPAHEHEGPSAPAAPCDCAEWCCCVPATTAPPVHAPTLQVAIVAAQPVALPTVVTTRVDRIDRLLPFANGPPRA